MAQSTMSIDPAQIKREMAEKLNISKAKLNRAAKQAGFAVTKHWHEQFTQSHFIRGAYTFYPEVYTKRKKAPKRPLFITGKLHNEIVRKGKGVQPTGTSKQVALRLPFGRPPRYSRATVVRLMEEVQRANPRWGETQVAMEAYKRLSDEAEKQIMARVVELMVKRKMDYKAAARKVYSAEGYSPEAKATFQRQIAYVNATERKKLAERFLGEMAAQIKAGSAA